LGKRNGEAGEDGGQAIDPAKWSSHGGSHYRKSNGESRLIASTGRRLQAMCAASIGPFATIG
jgi:hypothetical protein